MLLTSLKQDLRGAGPARDSDLLDRLDLSSAPAVVVAVSGGSDSTALLHLAQVALTRRKTRAPLHAVTIDHGLRQGSAREADSVAALCADLGIPHRTIRWMSGNPSAGIQDKARNARHALLSGAARDLGGAIVLTGHTLDDQAETVAMRKRRGEGRGLAAIAPAALVDGDIWFVRPLLESTRADLRAVLAREGLPWIDDPSNADPRFERAALRSTLSAAQRQAFVAEAADWRARRRAESVAAAALVREAVTMPSPGLYRIASGLWPDAPEADTAFRYLLAMAGGSAMLPAGDRSRALWRAGQRSALAGAVLESRREAAYLCRETRAGWDGEAYLRHRDIWDGRFRITLADPRGQARIHAAGLHASSRDATLPRRPVLTASAAEPVLHAAHDTRLSRLVSPAAHILPDHDLALVEALAEMAGGDLPGRSPWSTA